MMQGCVTESSLRRVVGDQSATSVIATRVGPIEVVTSRNYIGGTRPMPEKWRAPTSQGVALVRMTEGATGHPEMAALIDATVRFLETDLGLRPSVGRVDVRFVPDDTAVFEVRRSVARRRNATLELWSVAMPQEEAAVEAVVRSVAHELVHVSAALNRMRLGDEAEERLAYLVEHCAVLNVMTEVRRMPVAVLHGSPRSAPGGLARSLAAQREVFAAIPPVVRQNTPEAEALLARCRTALAAANSGTWEG